jgi:hypothetical protein
LTLTLATPANAARRAISAFLSASTCERAG